MCCWTGEMNGYVEALGSHGSERGRTANEEWGRRSGVSQSQWLDALSVNCGTQGGGWQIRFQTAGCGVGGCDRWVCITGWQ